VSVAHTVSCSVGIGALSPKAKRPGRESDVSHPFRAEVKNAAAILTLPMLAAQ
jgi:hypothetical protein